MAGYCKLSSSILDSSIWLESAETRIVWLTMLAMKDQDGLVEASIGGLAHRARVSREACEEALRIFQSPDPDSRDGTSGERIEAVPGGWLILNHDSYREQQTRQQKQGAERVRRLRDRRAAENAAADAAEAGAKDSTEYSMPEASTVTERDAPLRNAPKRAPVSASASASVSEIPVPRPQLGGSQSPRPCTLTGKEPVDPPDRGGGQAPPGTGDGERGQQTLFQLLCATTIRSNAKNRRRILGEWATDLDVQGLTPDMFRRLRAKARQESSGDPDALLATWLESGTWRDKWAEIIGGRIGGLASSVARARRAQ